MSQLDQLIGYLERDGVSEIVFGIGRPIAMRSAKGLVNITARPVSGEQLTSILRGSPLATMIPEHDVTEADPVEVQVGIRRVLVQIGRRGEEVVVRLTKPDRGAVHKPVMTQPIAVAPMPAAPVVDPEVRFRRKAEEPRPRTPSSAPEPRPRTPSSAPEPRPRTPSSAPSPPATRTTLADGVVDDRDAIDLGPLTSGLELELELDTGPYHTAAPSSLAAAGAIGLAAAKPAPPPPPPPVMPAMPLFDGTFGSLVRAARERNASDLHVAAARMVSLRIGSDLVVLEGETKPLTSDEVDALMLPLLDPTMREQLARLGYVDLALPAPDGGRLRANICRQQQGLKGTFRLALPFPQSLEQLGLPADLAKVVSHHQGLVVIAGPSGHGKTTTLAALVDLVNSTKPYHILTIEDPIEIVHGRKQAVISQREVGRHTESFARGLKASLREDPDVIVIGELRDRESVEIALTAAETGHLVLATMSTPSAAKTIDRLIDMFPPEEHSQVRASVAGALRAIVAQRLLPQKGGGVVPAVELVTGVLPLAVMIRDDKLFQLPNLMQRGRSLGMIRFDESLLELVRTGKIDEDLALANADSRKDLAAALQAKTTPMWKAPGR